MTASDNKPAPVLDIPGATAASENTDVDAWTARIKFLSEEDDRHGPITLPFIPKTIWDDIRAGLDSDAEACHEIAMALIRYYADTEISMMKETVFTSAPEGDDEMPFDIDKDDPFKS